MPEKGQKIGEIWQNMLETVKIDHKAAETRPTMCRIRISLQERIFPKIPTEIFAEHRKNRPKIAGNGQNRTWSSQTQPYRLNYGFKSKQSHGYAAEESDT